MKYIKLTKGKFAIVNDCDFDLVNQWKWSFDTNGYARRNDKGTKVYMHKLINKTPPGMITDHKNRNKLDNRRSNLRSVNKTDNLLNTGLWSHNKSGHKGISWSKSAKKWLSRIQFNKKVIFLGLFLDITKATKARKDFEIKNNINSFRKI